MESIHRKIKEIHEDLHKIKADVYELMTFIEESDEFQRQIDSELKRHFYHLYTKCKRNFIAINVLIESDDLENGYVEAVALLRVMLEAYFHLCYLMQTDKKKVLEEYQIMIDNKLKKMVSGRNKFEFSSSEDLEMLEVIRSNLKSKNTTIPNHLFKIPILAERTGNTVFYNQIYELFNTYVHFNPATYTSYGTFSAENEFTFDKQKNRPILEARVQHYASSVQMVLLNKIMRYLKIHEIPQSIINNFNNWTMFRDTKGKILLQNTDDYI